jgi:hypothetical protein
MTYKTIEYFPLESSYLCQDCNSISKNSRACPACASTVLMNLAGVLNREVTAVQEERVLTYTFPRTIAALSTKVA